jgi:hypothetical protein
MKETFENRPIYRINSFRPKNASKAAFDQIIGTISPTFLLVYNQAMQAESASLEQLTGMGLRKSLEFLVKDYLVKRHPTKTAEIETKQLAQCIKEFVDDDRLKDCALRAVWLGNDETHYVRKWTDKDVSDLKALIRLTVLWIERLEYTDQFIKSMPPTGPTSTISSAGS